VAENLKTITTNKISYGAHKNEIILSGGRRVALADDELKSEKLKMILAGLPEEASRLELKRPLDILKQVTIIDTPGLGDASKDFSADVEQALAVDVGKYLIQIAVLIALQEEYPGDGKLEETVQSSLLAFSGKELVLGVLSSTEDAPVQKEWIEAMKAELQKDFYSGKVSSELVIKYGNDVSADSKVQVGAFMRDGIVDCIIAPTTVGLAVAAEVLTDNNSEIGLTGLGLPSLMQSYMPVTETDNAFDYVCPYMLLWDVTHLGATAAAAAYAAVYDGFTGESGKTFEMGAFRDYEVTIYESYTSEKGTGILAGVPIVFYKGNMAEWVNVL